MKKTDRNPVKVPPAEPVSKRASAGSTDNLNLAEIKDLIELVAEKQFNDFELERGGFRLRIQKGVARTVAEWGQQTTSPSQVVVESGPIMGASTPASQTPTPAPAALEEKLHIITSPIVGTFYRSSSPAAEPFVKLGDSVERGKTLCIIEAMKLMNEIESDASGAIAKIFVENGQPVEFGQPLFGLRA